MRQFFKKFLPLSANLSNKKFLLLFSLFICCLDCLAKPSPGSHLPEDSNRLKILIISSYDAQSIKARKNKKELFAELVTTLQNDLAAEIRTKTSYEPVVISETLTGENYDNLLISLLQKNKPAKTIIIKAFDVWFDQTGVDVTEENGSKTRTAHFDLCSNVTYSLLNGENLQDEKEIKYREYFTHRNVASGFLSVGPDIVGKRKDAVLLMKNNAAAFMRSAAIWLSAP